MAIKELFGQAVYGTEEKDAVPALMQIHRSEINLVSAYMPPSSETQIYLQSLDAENRYITGHTDGAGNKIEIITLANYYYQDGDVETCSGLLLPTGNGYVAFLDDVSKRAALFQQVSGYESVHANISVLSSDITNVGWHCDNIIELRGLETLMGNQATLWLPDQHVDLRMFHKGITEEGYPFNYLLVTPEQEMLAQQMEKHCMSIHKGEAYPNPLFHSVPGYGQETHKRPGTRVRLTLNKADYVRRDPPHHVPSAPE